MTPQLILASASPRRLELLLQVGIVPRVHAVDIVELPDVSETPIQYSQRIARAKALTAWRQCSSTEQVFVLGADTEVVVDGQVLGKPLDDDDAARMLHLLSARQHQVLSSVALIGMAVDQVLTQSTEVEFAALDDAQIRRYLASGEYLGKAGAYGIQGRAAGFIRCIRGSYSSVMGLPLFETTNLLRSVGIG